MSIPSRGIGWSTRANLLWQISKQLEYLTGIMYARGNTTTTTTTTTQALFSDTIYWGEDSATACASTIPIVVTGDSTTFCNSNDFTSEDFRTIGTGGIFIGYDGQLKTVNVTSGSNVATFNGGCDPCPTTTTTTTTVVPVPFLMTVNIANPGTTVTLPYGGSATYTGTIDWGDATVTANSFATKQHTYASAGTYQITVDGTVGFWNAGYYSGPIDQLVSIDQFGNQFSFGDDAGTYFAGLVGLVSVASDIPLTGIANMYAMFSTCTNFNQDISGWNVSAITEMTGMFANATSFNQDLSSWCVTNIPTEPANFANGATLWILPKPVWGTCP